MPRYYDDPRSDRSDRDYGRRGEKPRPYVYTAEPSFGSSSYSSAGSSRYADSGYDSAGSYGSYGSSAYEGEYVPPPRSSYTSPPPPRAPSPPAAYTYEDEEPESISIAPAEWNGYKSSATREELETFFINRGMDKERVKREVGKEFAAAAPQHRAGIPDPGPSRNESSSQGSSYRTADAGSSAYDNYDPYDAPPRSSRHRTRSPSPPPRSSRNRARAPSPPPASYTSSHRSTRSRYADVDDDFINGMGGMRMDDEPPRRSNPSPFTTGSWESEVAYAMKNFGYSRTDAEEFARFQEKKAAGASAGRARSPSPSRHRSTKHSSSSSRDEREHARAKVIRKLMEEGASRRAAEEGADRHFARKDAKASSSGRKRY